MFLKIGSDKDEVYRLVNTKYISYFKVAYDRPMDQWVLVIHVSDTGLLYGKYNSKEDAEKELAKIRSIIEKGL